MSTAKLSVSFAEEDLAFLDAEAMSGRYASRSTVLHDAVRLLRESRLADSYAEGYDDEWDVADTDGLASASAIARRTPSHPVCPGRR